MKIELAFAGVFLSALTGWLIGALIAHPITGSEGLQFMGAFIGALLAFDILVIGEALKETK